MRSLLILTCFVASSLVGCSECDCSPNGTQLDIAPAAQGHVVDKRVSGPACDGYTPNCVNSERAKQSPDDITVCYLFPPRAGTCHVEVDFDDGTAFKTDLEFEMGEGCCGGAYAVGDDRIEVNMPSASRDAGVD